MRKDLGDGDIIGFRAVRVEGEGEGSWSGGWYVWL